MSEQSDRIRGALGRRWMTAGEIAEAVGIDPKYGGIGAIYQTLRSLVRHGYAEKRTVTVEGNPRPVAQWRRTA